MAHLFKLYFNSFKGLSKEVWWLALITLINRAGTMVIPFLSLYLTEDLKFTLTNVGWVMSAFGLGSVAGSWLGGKLTDKLGAYKIMVFSLIGSGFLFIGIQYVTDFTYLCLSIFVLTAVADLFRPALFVALNAYSKPENKTRSVTLIRLAINLGFSAGPAMAGIIIVSAGYGGLFWVDGITCVLAGLLFLHLFNPKKAPVAKEAPVANRKSAYTDGKYLIFILAILLFAIVFMQYFSTIPLYYKDGHHLTEFQIGLLFAGNGILIFLFEMPLVKWLESSKRSIFNLMIIGALMTGASFIILVITDWSGVLIIGLFLMSFGEMILFPFSNAFAMERSNLGNKGEYMALYMMAFSFGHIFSHNGGMQLIDNIGFDKTWLIISGLSLISVLLLLVLKRTLQKKNEALI
ncbi:MAG: putative MFS family arabinose efflux permease [Crocinitomix sp.]|jgi:predicted MFS family arabinose efflux permease